MLRIKIVSFGKASQTFIQEGIDEYVERLRSAAKFEFIELNSDKYSSLPPPELKKKEAELLFGKLKDKERFMALDEGGKLLSSVQFAEFIQKQSFGGTLCFAIGGAYGWDESVISSASSVLSLSHLTFTYQMSKLILVEQLYRAVNITKGSPYHK